ncbi:MAG: enolase C-terminal domain-like protein, partial [SAR202 cluster bacterium]|nr:enolase C-terminal domain-like protein [SAR202 cluster bacterium]
ELREIAAMAETYFVGVAPHNYNSTSIGMAATAHAAAAMPNFVITEYFVNLEEFGEDIAINPFKVEDGYIQVPDQPGIGIELDEDKLAAYPYRPFDARSPRQYHEEGP